MPKFEIEVQWHYKGFDYQRIEVEAENMDEAKAKALTQLSSADAGWSEGQIYEGHYEVNDDECKESEK